MLNMSVKYFVGFFYLTQDLVVLVHEIRISSFFNDGLIFLWL